MFITNKQEQKLEHACPYLDCEFATTGQACRRLRREVCQGLVLLGALVHRPPARLEREVVEGTSDQHGDDPGLLVRQTTHAHQEAIGEDREDDGGGVGQVGAREGGPVRSLWLTEDDVPVRSVSHRDGEDVADGPADGGLLPLEDIEQGNEVVQHRLDYVADGARDHEPEILGKAKATDLGSFLMR
eukprot:scaffold1446_cov175-Ochromonas_danica.AAC.12